MRSASAIAVCVATAGCALVAVAVSGCDTTQDAAARIKVRSERTLASRKPTKVREQAKDVKVKRATLLESKGGTALAVKPEVLLLDEPCSALDPQSTRVIEELIVKLREEVAVVIVTHNLQQAFRVADYVGFMYLGDLVEYANATTIFGSPRQQRTQEYVSGAFG